MIQNDADDSPSFSRLDFFFFCIEEERSSIDARRISIRPSNVRVEEKTGRDARKTQESVFQRNISVINLTSDYK